MNQKNKEYIDNNEPDISEALSVNTIQNDNNNNLKVEWSPENELIMVEWCDKAQCYKWLNTRAHNKYSYLHAWFTIPAIILSTISGTASFAQSNIPLAYQSYAPLLIGTINIFIGILTTIQQYLKISELNESHRVSAIAWDKFARNIKIELAKHPNERIDPKTFIKVCRQEFDRLMETSPDISENVIKEFKATFLGKVGSQKRINFDKLKKPDICDTIISVGETRHKWYLNLDSDIVTEIDKDDLIERQQSELADKQNKLNILMEQNERKMQQHNEEMEMQYINKQKEDENYNKDSLIIDKCINEFKNVYNRIPTKDEVINNIGDKINESILNKYYLELDIEQGN